MVPYHYFPQKMGIPLDEWYEKYFEEPSYKFLPQAQYDDFLDNYDNESFLRQERNEFFNLDKQYTGKIVDVEVEDDEQNKKEDDM